MAVLTAPFVRFLLALALGAGVGWAITPTQQLYAAVCGALVVIVSVFVTIGCITRLRQHRYYNVLGILVLQAWSFLGCLLMRSEEHTSELQSRENLVCRLLLEKKKSR